ncbi:MAG: 3-oxoacyl-ACP synthase III [Planctomycetes bacterium]|nr:3-oxoacyl-ACP synthase III [Planctomycetota bacterium]
MRYQHVCLEALSYTLPPHRVTSEELEQQLAPLYERLGLSVGRLELMTGIRERRFFAAGTRPGEVSARTARRALELSGLDRRYFGALIHGSVCRDQLEPATANSVHHALGLPERAFVVDVSNACLGLMNGMVMLANMIELGQVRAGVVVGTEDGRDLVEGTIDSLVNNPNVTRSDLKLAFASLTIGAGSAAVGLCDRKLSRTQNRLLGGVFRADTSSHRLCEGDVEAEKHGDDRPRMQTDSEALLHAGVDLAAATWQRLKRCLGWDNTDVDKAFTHQVGRAHRKLLYERLGLDPAIDFSTVEFLGNTGSVALPMSLAMGVERGHVQPDDRVALLGIGSGLNAIMLGLQWQQNCAAGGEG